MARSAHLMRDRQPTALVVDRDLEVRLMYGEFLRLVSWQVDEASDGREALAKAIAFHPDVVITETRLPGIDGITLCELLRRDATTHTIPVVFVTADAPAADIERARRAGGDLVLTKPCLPERLLTELHALLARSAAVENRTGRLQGRAAAQVALADELLNQVAGTVNRRRHTLKKAHHRGDTMDPPLVPPALFCPLCDRPLTYRRSHVGGVSSKHSEQWDYFECDGGCGPFQYRARTRKLRKVV
jgi:CheY-like chemotaxis protein